MVYNRTQITTHITYHTVITHNGSHPNSKQNKEYSYIALRLATRISFVLPIITVNTDKSQRMDIQFHFVTRNLDLQLTIRKQGHHQRSQALLHRFLQGYAKGKGTAVPVINQQEVLGTTNRLLSLIRHGPHWKRRVHQFFYCCVCILYASNVYTEPLPSNDRRYTQRQMGGEDFLITP
jgi:hypothetical protein